MLRAIQFILGICALLLRFSILMVLCFSIVAGAAPRFSNVGRCSLQPYPISDASKLDSCQLCEIDDAGMLSCTCVDSKGDAVASSLPIYSCPKHYAYPLCAGSIEVNEGRLTCRKISPESTYDERGCFSCEKIGYILRCDCVKQGREHVSSLLDLSTCNQPISNCHGQLTCGLCVEPQTNSWIWLQATAVGAIVVGTGLVIVRWLISRNT